jgi:DNA repair exonuclease SbcCD nuclease subunit
MTFRFIHTADWQLGKPFTNLPADLAGELQAARFAVVGRIAEVAASRSARHVFVAGDVYDGENLSNATLRRGLERMAEHPNIQWLLLPGNHDPARAGGVWDRIQRFGAPANIVLVLNSAPISLDGNVVVLPAPLTTKNPGRDPTEWMDAAVTAAGVHRIGLAHGSIQGFGSDGESAVLLAKDRAARAGLSYLALGDWHGVTRVSDNTWYSGTPEPDRFPNNDPGYVLSVSIDGRGANVEKVATGQFAWVKTTATLSSINDLAGIEASFKNFALAPSRVLMRLALAGSLSMAEHTELDAWVETWSARLRFLSLDASSVAVRPSAADFDIFGAEGPLIEAARTLAATAADAAHPETASAQLALRRLYGFAAQAVAERAL